MIGDFTGYVASTYKRGVKFVQVPTTLLAMVDSSIGGKNGVDTPAGKNLIGTFWQPSRIYVDLDFLNSLPEREFINGMAEVVKTAAIWDKQKFNELEAHAMQLMDALRRPVSKDDNRLTKVKGVLKDIVLGSIAVKAEVVTQDEREGGLRNILNFGHSIGHAIEGILTPEILHGECVAIGMVLEADLSRLTGLLSGDAVARLRECLASYGLPVSLKDTAVRERSNLKHCAVDKIMEVMAVDKKNVGKSKRVTLLEDIGRTHQKKAVAVSDQDLKVVLSSGIRVLSMKDRRFSVSCRPPGSKSISNRALLLASLGTGKCRLSNLLLSDDTEHMKNALVSLKAATFKPHDGGVDLIVDGHGGHLEAPSEEIYIGNAGTAARFLTSIATIARSGESDYTILTGNSAMKKRKIGPLVTALRNNSAAIEYIGKAEDPEEASQTLPLRIEATEGIKGGDINLSATFSSQYVSSILMCAPLSREQPVTLRLVGGSPVSQTYIDMTTALMGGFGVHVTKSEAEDHTYHIPQTSYQNPPSFEVESDASSATYPLAIAAITGSTCTVPNIGSSSLQGDARFAVDVLKPMGCKVEQSASSTTVTGPPVGALQPLEVIDMEPMTDAFLTCAILAAVAQGRAGKSTTRIVGIANQRGKECNRIQAMRVELAKFGVSCRELANGIEIDGIDYRQLQTPQNGVDCYDDHRVAMSFSVLALVAPKGALIRERECVGKTWPGWWETLRNTFGARLEGVDLENPSKQEPPPDSVEYDGRSIYLIGMRGAGKTTTGKHLADALEHQFVDLDSLLEENAEKTIPEIIQDSGWDGFRTRELALLKTTLRNKKEGCVFSCGGGIVEIPEARQTLINYHESGGLVILVQRDIEDIVDYLQVDKSRPAYVDDMRSVIKRRQPWYDQCSNYQYYSQRAPSHSLDRASKELERFIAILTGKRHPFDRIRSRDRSFFVSLTVPDVAAALDFIPEVVVGSDAVELRVDLLEDPSSRDIIPSLEYVANQLAILRGSSDLPIIFTVRTIAQGGKFPDGAHKEMFSLLNLALRTGVEFLDLEISLPESVLRFISRRKGHTKIIASHHDPEGNLSWTGTSNSWTPHWEKALLYGDIAKLVGVATCQDDNFKLLKFKEYVSNLELAKPLIAINMRRQGQLSRVQNTLLTPVSHPALPFKAAPGQLSAAEIRTCLSRIGAIEPSKFYLFGKPINQSRSPAMHNSQFNQHGFPHVYNLLETDKAEDVEKVIANEDFGGASVTIPLKLDIMPHLDDISEDAKTIGAVNTLIADHSRESKSGQGFHLTGRNTDWQGMVKVLENAGARSATGQSGLVVGGGGTARAAIYALHQMRFTPIYLLGRSASKIEALIESFPKEYNLQLFKIRQAQYTFIPSTAIGTIPADRPIEHDMREALVQLFAQQKKGFLLEMAYGREATDLMELAQQWEIIPGLEVLAAQALYQFEAWTGIMPRLKTLREACGLED